MTAHVETMAYSGETPWHGLGLPVEDNLTPDEMLVAAQLDWGVGLEPLYINGDGNMTAVKGQFALLRQSDRRVLDIVGSSYKPFQNADAMDFFSKFVKAGNMKMETAGSLKGGQFIWALAKIEHDFKIGRNDQMLSYLLMMQPHKLGRAMIFQTTAIRVVCWNTLSMALGASLSGRGNAYRVPHLAAFDDNAKAKAEEALGLATKQLDSFNMAANRLSRVKVTDEQVKAFFAKLLGQDEPVAANDDEKKPSRRLLRLVEAYETAPGQALASAKGTLWGAVNAVTYDVDHVHGRTTDGRLTKAWFGSGARLKLRALNEALKLAA